MTSSPDGQPTGRTLRPPSLGLLLAEMRGIFELNASLMMSPLLMRAPRGDGHPVLALPGFLASDLSMAPLRRYLTELGYDAHAWQMGRNLGGLSRVRAALRERLAAIHASTGRKVSVVGWSLGGVYARDLALHAPALSAQESGASEAPPVSMDMAGLYGAYDMAREASGTSWQPDSTPLEGVHEMRGAWMTMLHGFADAGDCAIEQHVGIAGSDHRDHRRRRINEDADLDHGLA